ncbi:MAG: hypothetical protein U0704_06940 [Candidatus Eisenbacteria bacterium]
MLYELLTGRSPHGDGRTIAELERAALDGTIAPPSRAVSSATVAKQLTGDLDTISSRARS